MLNVGKKISNEFLMEGKYYNYISNIFTTVANYYNYKFIRMPLLKTDVVKDNEISKFCYFNTKEFGIEVFGKESLIIDAEVISFVYRVIEAMGIDELVVKLRNVNDDDESKNRFDKILEYLRYLDVDYEIDSNLKVSKNNGDVAFQLECELNNLGVITLATGSINANNSEWIASTDEIINALKEINKDKEMYDTIDVYVVAKNEEEILTAIKLAQDLRWSDVRVEMAASNSDRDSQFAEADKLGARQLVILNKDDLNKGLVTIKDNLTKEEVKVDEIEVIDYIISNL